MISSVSNRVKRELGLALVVGSGIGSVAVHLLHATGAQEDLATFLVGILIPLLFGVGLAVGGMWLSWSDTEPDYILRIGLWTVFMAVVVTGGQSMTILYQHAEGTQMSHPLYVLADAATAGGVVGYVIGLYDARQQRARHRTERLQDQLTVLNRVLRHDIRNGATVIEGHAELIAEQVRAGEHAARIQRQAEDLVKLGEHARAIEQLQQEQGSSRKAIEITDMLVDHIETLESTHSNAVFQSNLSFEGDAYAHPLIDIAIENVLQNAVEHSTDPEPTVTVDCRAVQARRNTLVEIQVADTGPGIPPDEVAVLERGYETPLDHTSGLGLWLVNWIVTESGGEVWFEENEPTGSIVCMRLETSDPDPLTNPLPIAN